VGSVEKHNERDPEYLKAVKASGRNIYFFQNLTQNNCSWVNPEYKDKTCEQLFEELKQLYTDKVGQAPQLKEKTRKNKKGQEYKIAGWSPIREAVIPIKADTTIDDFKPVIEWLKSKGWNTVRIDLHKDEGNIDKVTGETKMNYHAHYVVDTVDHQTGRTVKLNEKDMSLDGFQGIVADALKMERGIAKKVTGAEHRDLWQQREWAAAQRVIELDKEARRNDIKAKGLSKMIENLTVRRNDIQEEIRQLEEDVREGRSSSEDIRQQLQQLHKELDEVDKKMKDKKEKLDQAGQQLEMILDQKAEAQHKYDDLQRAINRDLPTLEGRVIRDFQAMGWKMATQETKSVLEKINEHSRALSSRPMAKYQFDEEAGLVFYGNILGEMAIRGEEITLVAGALYLGYIDQAMQFAQSHGGGGSSPDSGWGRRPDEDDEAFKMRCFGMARMMMKPAGRSQQQSRAPKR
jgi:hypothetical protein